MCLAETLFVLRIWSSMEMLYLTYSYGNVILNILTVTAQLLGVPKCLGLSTSSSFIFYQLQVCIILLYAFIHLQEIDF